MKDDPFVQTVLDAASRRKAQIESESLSSSDLARSGVEGAADALEKVYGEAALDQAIKLESSATDPLFAAQVRRELEARKA